MVYWTRKMQFWRFCLQFSCKCLKHSLPTSKKEKNNLFSQISVTSKSFSSGDVEANLDIHDRMSRQKSEIFLLKNRKCYTFLRSFLPKCSSGYVECKFVDPSDFCFARSPRINRWKSENDVKNTLHSKKILAFQKSLLLHVEGIYALQPKKFR